MEARFVMFYEGLRLWEAGFELGSRGDLMNVSRNLALGGSICLVLRGSEALGGSCVRVLRVGEAPGGSDV